MLSRLDPRPWCGNDSVRYIQRDTVFTCWISAHHESHTHQNVKNHVDCTACQEVILKWYSRIDIWGRRQGLIYRKWNGFHVMMCVLWVDVWNWSNFPHKTWWIKSYKVSASQRPSYSIDLRCELHRRDIVACSCWLILVKSWITFIDPKGYFCWFCMASSSPYLKLSTNLTMTFTEWSSGFWIKDSWTWFYVTEPGLTWINLVKWKIMFKGSH